MAERTVFWKAVADFSSIARQAALARRELDSLDKREQRYTQEHANRVNKQVAANKHIIDSNRQVASSSSTAARGLTDFAKAQRAAGDATVRFNRVLQTNTSELGDANTKMRQFTRTQDTMRLETDRSYMAMLRFNEQLGELNSYGEGAFAKIKNAATDARKEIGELRNTMRETSGTAESNARAQVEANARVEASANRVVSKMEGLLGRLNEISAAHQEGARSARTLDSSLASVNSSLDRHNSTVTQSTTKHRTFRTDIDGTSIALGRLERMLANLANSAPSLSSALTNLTNRMTGMSFRSRENATSLNLLNSAFANFKGEGTLNILTTFSNRLTAVGGLAMVASDAIGRLAGSLALLGPGLVGAVGALSPVVGLLGTLPGLAVAATGAFGSTIGSLRGVGAAYKAYSKQQEASAKTSLTNAKQQADNNRRILQAEQSLVQARRNATRSIRDAERSLRDARESSSRAAVDAARSIKAAEESVARSKENVIATERRLEQAQKNVNQARQDAVRNLRDLERATQSYALQEEGASIALEESRERLKEVMADPGSTDLQRRAARLAVREAEARLQEVRQASQDHDAELAEARRKGVEGSDEVVSALDAERSAQESVRDSKRAAVSAEEALVRAREDASRSIRDANESVVRAEENLRDAQISAAEATQKAAQAIEDAADKADAGTGKVDEFAEAMKKLTPEGQAVVRQLIAMRDGWESMGKAAETATLPGVLPFLRSVELLFPRITKFISEAGSIMGTFFADLGRMATSESAMKAWNIVLDDGVRIMENWSEGLLNIAAFIGDISVAAAKSGLNDWLGEIVVGWTEVWRAWASGEEGQDRVISFFEKAMRSAELLGSIVGGITGFFFNVGQAGEEAGWKILTSFDGALRKFNEWSNTREGFESIKEIADISVPVFEELGRLVVAMAQGMGELAKNSEAGAVIKQLREEFGPVLLEVLKQLENTNVLGNFITMISKIGKSITESGLLGSLGDLVNQLMELGAEAIPAITPFVEILIDVLDWLASALTWVFREMNKGNAAVQGLVGAFVTLVGIAAFGILIRNITRFVKSFIRGFQDVANVLIKTGDGVDKFENKITSAIDRIVRHFKKLDQAKYSAGFTFAEGAEPRRRLANDEDITRRQPAYSRPVRVSGDSGGINIFRGGVPPTIPAPKIDTRAAKEAASRAALGVTDEYIDGVRRGLRQGQSQVSNSAKNVGEAVDKGVRTEVGEKDGLLAAGFYTEGLTRGLKLDIRKVHRAGEDVGEAIVDGTEDELDISSPSRKAIEIAKNFTSAIANTLRRERGDVSKAGEDIGEEMVSGVEKKVRGSQGRLSSALKWGLGALVAGASVIVAGGGGLAVDALRANDQLQASLRKTNELFGASAGTMETWAGTAASTMGISRNEALTTANNFGLLFQKIGMGKEESARLSQEMTLLAASLVAANPGLDIQDAYEALEDAFDGNYTTLAKLNPSFNDSAILQQALRDSGKKTNEELTEQEKRSAFLKIAHEKAQESTKILADRQDEAGGAFDRAKAKWADFKTELGKKIGHTLGDLVEDLEDPTTQMGKLREQLEKLIDNEENLENFAIVLGGFATALTTTANALAHVIELTSSAPKKAEVDEEWDRANKKALDARKKELLKNDSEIRSISVGGYWDREGGAHATQLGARYGLTSADMETRRGFRLPSTEVYREIIAEAKARQQILAESKGQGISTTGRGRVPSDGVTGIRPKTYEQGVEDGKPYGRGISDGNKQGMDEKGPQTAIDRWVQKWIIDPFKRVLGISSPSTVFAGFGGDVIQGFFNGITTKILEAPGKIRSWFNDNLVTPFKAFFGIASPSTMFSGFGGDVVDGFFNGIFAKVLEAPTKIRTWFNDNVVVPFKEFFGIQSPSTVFSVFGGDVVSGFLNGILTAILTAPTKLRSWFNDNVLTPVKEFLGIQSPSTVFFAFAEDVVRGFINGIISKASETYTFIKRWFDENIIRPVKEFLGIQSPSTVFFGFAEEVVQGFINGITSKARETYDFIKRWFDDNIVRPVKEFLGIQSPSTVFHRVGTDLIQGLINGINSMFGPAGTAATNLVNEIARRFGELGGKMRGPVQYVVDVVYNDGIRKVWNAVAGLVNLGQLPEVKFNAARDTMFSGGGSAMMGQFAEGGHTGRGSKYKPAGIVHADEFVVKKSSRRKFESQNPGLLDHINRTGSLPGRGYFDGGHVTQSSAPVRSMDISGTPTVVNYNISNVPEYAEGGLVSYKGGRFTRVFAAVLQAAERLAGTSFNITQGGWNPGGVRASGTSHHGDAVDIVGGDLRKIALALRQSGVAAWVRTPAQGYIYHVHGVPLPGKGTPGGSAVWQAQDYLRGGNGLGGRDEFGGPTAINGMPIPDFIGDVAGFFFNPVASLRDKFKEFTNKAHSFGNSPFVKAVTSLPRMMVDGLVKKAEESWAALAPHDDSSMSGGVAGPDWQANANLLMQAGRAMGLSKQAMKIALMTAAQESSMGTNQTAMRRINRDGDVGWFQNRATRGDGTVAQLADPAYALRVFIHGKTVPAGYHVPGLYNIRGWEGMRPGDAAQRVQVSAYPRAYDKWADDAERWMATFGFSDGGHTGPGGKYKPAGIVHADEFVVKKESRQRFERENPGTLDYINRTGKLPGYHEGGRVIRTGGEGGTWWKKGTYSLTGKWIGALRHFFGLDNWWGGWDDDLDNAIRNYDGRPATHVYLPEWRPIIDAMRRLPLQEFSSAQNVAAKIGVHPDKIFRMIDTNRAHFDRDLGDRRKIEALEPSYARFRDFHRESVEELQKVLGVPVDGYWNMRMRELLLHVKEHVTGKPHPDNLPTGDGWSTVGSWGAAFDEILLTNRLNAEWDRMMDQFYEWGYDSLIRHLNNMGVDQGMELARDLYNVPLHARDADVYYREFYEREDRIKDENSELNRMRAMVNYLRRYDNVGLQGLASELELTMDTTAMIFKKAKDKGMLSGLSTSKISRLDKDIINFDKIFRFALGGLVPGSGNADSVFALLTPGEYVLTKDQTKELMAVQNMFARYSGPSMKGNPSAMAGMLGGGNVINNNVAWNVTQNITAPSPQMTSVKVQQGMKRLADEGLNMGGDW